MIYAKPGSLLEMRAGKAIGAQTGLAATINWIVSCLANARYDDEDEHGSTEIEGLDSGYPLLSRGNKFQLSAGNQTFENVKSVTIDGGDNIDVTATDEGDGCVKISLSVHYS